MHAATSLIDTRGGVDLDNPSLMHTSWEIRKKTWKHDEHVHSS